MAHSTDRSPETDLLSCRMARISLDPTKLTPQHLAVLREIEKNCLGCEKTERCVAGLAAAPDKGWEDWDEYCPNAQRLRILAALAMFPDDDSPGHL
jgi:hypothetical protein